MTEEAPSRKCRSSDAGDGERLRLRRSAEEEEGRARSPNPTFQLCAELALPWLPPPDLAHAALTCKALHRAAEFVNLRRSTDAARGFESDPIPFVNSVDSVPYAYFLYAPSQVLHSIDRQPWGSGTPGSALRGSMSHPSAGQLSWASSLRCECERCGDDGSPCPCSKSGGFGEVAATECGPHCKCGLDCVNRATQRGVSVRLKIVRVAGKGWGLFADQAIEEGQFVCEYAGELLRTEEARRRQQEYDQLSKRGGFSAALLVVREHLPSREACIRINIDATRVGNVARFINHSCDGGNLSTVLVRSTGDLLPRLCFFASKDIGRGEELSFSYGESRLWPESGDASPCFCGASSCPGILPSENT